MAEQKPSVLLSLVILPAAFIGSGPAGLLLSQTFAPASVIADLVSGFMLPLSAFLGLISWIGLAILIELPGFLLRLAKGKLRREDPVQEVPSGSIAFFIISPILTSIAGIITGIVATSAGYKSSCSAVGNAFATGSIQTRLKAIEAMAALDCPERWACRSPEKTPAAHSFLSPSPANHIWTATTRSSGKSFQEWMLWSAWKSEPGSRTCESIKHPRGSV